MKKTSSKANTEGNGKIYNTKFSLADKSVTFGKGKPTGKTI